MSLEDAAHTTMRRCDALAAYSEETGALTRRFATPALRDAVECVAEWMRAAGMTTRIDNIGNLHGRYEAAEMNAPTLLLGSHLDSVRNAGRYDGPLGVLVALACVEELHRQGRRLPFAIEVLGFADEEGVRFHTAYLGSSVFAGCFDATLLDRCDSDGISMAEAISAWGGDPALLPDDCCARDDLLGYLEVHIEQGPQLEAQGIPVGVVSAIQGQSRVALRFIGEAGHAGTVPMSLRHDALCAAAEFVLLAEQIAKGTAGLVATVGQLVVEPGASNVISGETNLSVDIRHQDDGVREHARDLLHKRAAAIAEARGCMAEWQVVQETGAVPCDAGLSAILGRAVAGSGYPAISLASGAGHDAAVVSRVAPVAMLFVRCAGGISHNPAEAVREDDVAATIGVVLRTLDLLAEQ